MPPKTPKRRKVQWNVRAENGHLWQVTAQGPRSAVVAFAAKWMVRYGRWPPLEYRVELAPRPTPEDRARGLAPPEPTAKLITAHVIAQAGELLVSGREF